MAANYDGASWARVSYPICRATRKQDRDFRVQQAKSGVAQNLKDRDSALRHRNVLFFSKHFPFSSAPVASVAKKKRLNTEITEILCALCVSAWEARRTQKVGFSLRPKAALRYAQAHWFMTHVQGV
jgi:hypothetical protein